MLILSFCLPTGGASAGEVVTDDQRQWACAAIANESAIDTKAAANTVSILYFDSQTRRYRKRRKKTRKKWLRLITLRAVCAHNHHSKVLAEHHYHFQ